MVRHDFDPDFPGIYSFTGVSLRLLISLLGNSITGHASERVECLLAFSQPDLKISNVLILNKG